WGTVTITRALSASSAAAAQSTASPPYESLTAGDAYNGKMLPDASVRTMQIRAAAPGAALADSTEADGGPQVKAAENHAWSKVAHAREHVVFPVVEAKPMPSGN